MGLHACRVRARDPAAGVAAPGQTHRTGDRGRRPPSAPEREHNGPARTPRWSVRSARSPPSGSPAAARTAPAPARAEPAVGARARSDWRKPAVRGGAAPAAWPAACAEPHRAPPWPLPPRVRRRWQPPRPEELRQRSKPSAAASASASSAASLRMPRNCTCGQRISPPACAPGEFGGRALVAGGVVQVDDAMAAHPAGLGIAHAADAVPDARTLLHQRGRVRQLAPVHAGGRALPQQRRPRATGGSRLSIASADSPGVAFRPGRGRPRGQQPDPCRHRMPVRAHGRHRPRRERRRRGRQDAPRSP